MSMRDYRDSELIAELSRRALTRAQGLCPTCGTSLIDQNCSDCTASDDDSTLPLQDVLDYEEKRAFSEAAQLSLREPICTTIIVEFLNQFQTEQGVRQLVHDALMPILAQVATVVRANTLGIPMSRLIMTSAEMVRHQAAMRVKSKLSVIRGGRPV